MEYLNNIALYHVCSDAARKAHPDILFLNGVFVCVALRGSSVDMSF